MKNKPNHKSEPKHVNYCMTINKRSKRKSSSLMKTFRRKLLLVKISGILNKRRRKVVRNDLMRLRQ